MTQNLPTEDDSRRVDGELLIEDEAILNEANEGEIIDDAEKAIEQMKARERRRDGSYDTGGDDQSAGIDNRMNANAPKEMNKD